MPGAGVVHDIIFDRVSGFGLQVDVRLAPKATMDGQRRQADGALKFWLALSRYSPSLTP